MGTTAEAWSSESVGDIKHGRVLGKAGPEEQFLVIYLRCCFGNGAAEEQGCPCCKKVLLAFLCDRMT